MIRLAASITARTSGGAPLGGSALPSARIRAPQVVLVRSPEEAKGRHSTLLGPRLPVSWEAEAGPASAAPARAAASAVAVAERRPTPLSVPARPPRSARLAPASAGRG